MIAVDVTQYGFIVGAPRSVGEAVMRAFDIMARQTIATSLEWADVVIRPPVAGVNGFRFASAPDLIRKGYEAATEAMPAIVAQLAALRRDVVS